MHGTTREQEPCGAGDWVLLDAETSGSGADGGDGPVKTGTRVVLLGVSQDAGVPQCGCRCRHCSAVLAGRLPPKSVVSLAVVHNGDAWLVDASPDLKWNLHALRQAEPEATLRGILLTHLHMGHYTGLLQLGKEVMSTHKLPVYATASACRFLRENQPWRHLVEVDRNVELVEVVAGEEVQLGGARVRPCAVPHRGEYSDTVAYFVEGAAGGRLFYCPDIDSWDEWELKLSEVCDSVDVQLVDATFFSAKELPGRDISKIPHPFITTTAARLPELEQRRKTVLIHLNHSNPVYLEGSPEREWCLEQGFKVGEEGMSWQL